MKQIHEKVSGLHGNRRLSSCISHRDAPVAMVTCALPPLQVNIIPVIAKADTLTPEECARFKKTVSDPPSPPSSSLLPLQAFLLPLLSLTFSLPPLSSPPSPPLPHRS